MSYIGQLLGILRHGLKITLFLAVPVFLGLSGGLSTKAEHKKFHDKVGSKQIYICQPLDLGRARFNLLVSAAAAAATVP
jgi:hypothetical protein